MAKIQTTLHPKDSPNDELYPNVLPSNIPVGSGLTNTGDVLEIDNTYVQPTLTASVGINIDNNVISLADNVTKQITFSQGIKSTKILDTSGYNIISGDGSYRTVGDTSKILQLNGSAVRPSYNGNDLALLSDSNTSHWNLLMANLGIGRWRNQEFSYYSWYEGKPDIYDNLLPYYTNFTKMFYGTTFLGTSATTTTRIMNDFPLQSINLKQTFLGCKIEGTLLLSNCGGDGFVDLDLTFAQTSFTKIDFRDDVTPWKIRRFNSVFYNSPNLEEIGAFDLSNALNSFYEAFRCPKLKHIHCTHFKISFDIYFSTAFEEADLVEIISNLDPVSTTQTLTMGATNLAKLTSEEILVATGKGWQLA